MEGSQTSFLCLTKFKTTPSQGKQILFFEVSFAITCLVGVRLREFVLVWANHVQDPWDLLIVQDELCNYGQHWDFVLIFQPMSLGSQARVNSCSGELVLESQANVSYK